MKKPWKLSRRTLLRGAGACLALPLMEAMGPSTLRAASKRPPVRFGALFVPNGFYPDAWKPKSEGALAVLPETLQPLDPVKRKVLVLTGLKNERSFVGEGHHVKTACWLTGVEPAKADDKDIQVGVSVDQLAAQKIGMFTPLPSLELGCDGKRTGLDMGYSRIYGSHISWRTPTTPVAKIVNPADAFDRLFRSKRRQAAGGDVERDESLFVQDEAGDEKLISDDKSVIDAVLEDAKALQAKIGQADHRKLEEYLDAVRELEKGIERSSRPQEASDWRPTTLPRLNRPEGGTPQDHAEHVKLMLDMMLMAFWTDSTRLSTFMLGNAVSGTNMSFIQGVGGSHHEISHHNNAANMVEQYKRINRWHVEQLGYLLQQMDKVDEGEGTLLDNSMILFGSGIMDGNAHNPRELPVVFAGRGGGSIKSGRHAVCKGDDARMCNLYLEVLARVGAPAKQFGDSTGGLPELR